jgi:hypothetical protein
LHSFLSGATGPVTLLFIPLLTSFYIGLFGRFIGKTGGFQLARFGILLS